MADELTPLGKNPGWAGEVGEFDALTEADVRGTGYVGTRPTDGGHPGASCSYPYQLTARDPDAPLFQGPYAERLQKILSRYPDARRGALLPVLNMAHELHGYLSPDAMTRVAELLDLEPAVVRGVASFYTMYNKQPVGSYLIQVCTNVACNLCGADDVMAAFLDHAGVEPGTISDDGAFTVIEAECLGACGFPTAVQINERYFENVTPGDVPAILQRLQGELSNAREIARSSSVESSGPSRDEPSGPSSDESSGPISDEPTDSVSAGDTHGQPDGGG